MNIYIYDRYIHRCLYMHAACNTRDGESASGFGEEEEEEEEEAQDATVESPQSPDARCTARPSAALCASLHARCGLRWGRLRAAGGRRGNRSGGGGMGSRLPRRRDGPTLVLNACSRLSCEPSSRRVSWHVRCGTRGARHAMLWQGTQGKLNMEKIECVSIRSVVRKGHNL